MPDAADATNAIIPIAAGGSDWALVLLSLRQWFFNGVVRVVFHFLFPPLLVFTE